jgi:hypothetical protein
MMRHRHKTRVKPDGGEQHRRTYRLAFFAIATFVLSLVVLVPFAVNSVFHDLIEPAEGVVYTIAQPPAEGQVMTYSRLHVGVVAIDELGLRATLRVSGHHDCRTPCDWSTEVVFFSFRTHEAESAGMPPSASVTLPPSGTSNEVVTQDIQLPIRGAPSRYPFDWYQMWLGVAVLRKEADGTVTPFPPAEARQHLFLTVQEQLPREEMGAPDPRDPASFHDEDDAYPYVLVNVLTFTRPLHLKLLAVLLVLLIAAAAAYAVFMRPLQELVINAGGLVLGVWGIRSILSPSNPPYLTTVDLSLSLVILFLLGAITMRALQLCQRHSELRLFRPRARGASTTPYHPERPSAASTNGRAGAE